jgi:hypothetical protein
MTKRGDGTMTQPYAVEVTMWNVGFGDAFLITFFYDPVLPDGRSTRSMLVDLGTTKRAKLTYPEIAKDLAAVGQWISRCARGISPSP